jgi:hypothetical protein
MTRLASYDPAITPIAEGNWLRPASSADMPRPSWNVEDAEERDRGEHDHQGEGSEQPVGEEPQGR